MIDIKGLKPGNYVSLDLSKGIYNEVESIKNGNVKMKNVPYAMPELLIFGIHINTTILERADFKVALEGYSYVKKAGRGHFLYLIKNGFYWYYPNSNNENEYKTGSAIYLHDFQNIYKEFTGQDLEVDFKEQHK